MFAFTKSNRNIHKNVRHSWNSHAPRYEISELAMDLRFYDEEQKQLYSISKFIANFHTMWHPF